MFDIRFPHFSVKDSNDNEIVFQVLIYDTETGEPVDWNESESARLMRE